MLLRSKMLPATQCLNFQLIRLPGRGVSKLKVSPSLPLLAAHSPYNDRQFGQFKGPLLRSCHAFKELGLCCIDSLSVYSHVQGIEHAKKFSDIGQLVRCLLRRG